MTADDYYVDCTSNECGWEGLRSATIEPDGAQLCPTCKSPTEPHR